MTYHNQNEDAAEQMGISDIDKILKEILKEMDSMFGKIV
jgi:hypothetical protein